MSLPHPTALLKRHHRLSVLALHWLLTIWFTISSVGAPLLLVHTMPSEGMSGCASSPDGQCRCSLKKRMSGTCCCSRKSQQSTDAREVTSSDSATRSCCGLKTPSEPSHEPSCCSKKSISSAADRSTKRAASKSSDSPKERILAIESSPCGSDSHDELLVNLDPRLQLQEFLVTFDVPDDLRVAWLQARNVGERLEPPTPPPRDMSAV